MRVVTSTVSNPGIGTVFRIEKTCVSCHYNSFFVTIDPACECYEPGVERMCLPDVNFDIGSRLPSASEVKHQMEIEEAICLRN